MWLETSEQLLVVEVTRSSSYAMQFLFPSCPFDYVMHITTKRKCQKKKRRFDIFQLLIHHTLNLFMLKLQYNHLISFICNLSNQMRRKQYLYVGRMAVPCSRVSQILSSCQKLNHWSQKILAWQGFYLLHHEHLQLHSIFSLPYRLGSFWQYTTSPVSLTQ